MILEEQSFKIKKIKETNENWLLYPKGAKEPIELSKERVYGKLPPIWKFPWNYHILNIKTAANYITYAEMDGIILFDTPEEQYPEHVKKAIARIRKIDEDYEQMQKKYLDMLKAQLTEYLPQVPEVKELEDSFTELPVCWHMYLKLRLPMLYQNDDSRQRLTLMYWLITIANRLYKRHANGESDFKIGWLQIDFLIRTTAVSNLNDTLVNEIENNPDWRNNVAFTFYFEARAELRRVLPQAPSRLEVYLVRTICRLITAYAEDLATLNIYRRRGLLTGNKLYSDYQEYYWWLKDMKLPKISSLIIEKEFTDEEIAKFKLNF